MRTAKATPKPPPGSAESLRQKTADLEHATALLNAAKVVEELSEPKASRTTDAHVKDRDLLFDLEMQVRQMSHLATIVTEWAQEQNFYHQDSGADDDTEREHHVS